MLSAERQEIFDRFSAKAISMGLIRTDTGDNWERLCYQVKQFSHTVIGCSVDRNDQQAGVQIYVMVNLPSTTKYAKLEFQYYSINGFEALDDQVLPELAKHVDATSDTVDQLEAQLKALRKDLTKYTKKTLGV